MEDTSRISVNMSENVAALGPTGDDDWPLLVENYQVYILFGRVRGRISGVENRLLHRHGLRERKPQRTPPVQVILRRRVYRSPPTRD